MHTRTLTRILVWHSFSSTNQMLCLRGALLPLHGGYYWIYFLIYNGNILFLLHHIITNNRFMMDVLRSCKEKGTETRPPKKKITMKLYSPVIFIQMSETYCFCIDKKYRSTLWCTLTLLQCSSIFPSSHSTKDVDVANRTRTARMNLSEKGILMQLLEIWIVFVTSVIAISHYRNSVFPRCYSTSGIHDSKNRRRRHFVTFHCNFTWGEFSEWSYSEILVMYYWRRIFYSSRCCSSRSWNPRLSLTEIFLKIPQWNLEQF